MRLNGCQLSTWTSLARIGSSFRKRMNCFFRERSLAFCLLLLSMPVLISFGIVVCVCTSRCAAFCRVSCERNVRGCVAMLFLRVLQITSDHSSIREAGTHALPVAE